MPFPRLLSLSALALTSLAFAQTRPLDYVNPFVGTDGHGHTFPGATTPFGMVQLSPDTRTDTWDGCSGYHYSDKTILGFSHTHLAGTGVGCLGDVLLMPSIGTAGAKSAFSHDDEEAKPGYYRVFLKDPGINAELTATPHAGMHRYTFPASEDGTVLIDLNHGIMNDTTGTSLEQVDDHTLKGYRMSSGWGGPRVVYFYLQASKPWKKLDWNSGDGKGWIHFETRSGEKVQFKVGISATGAEGAANNLKTEIPGWDFDAVRRKAEEAWNAALSRVEVKSDDRDALETFYTNAYLCYLAPNLFNDADNAYLGMDRNVHRGASFQNYSTFSLWDTFRALHPLLTITQPERVSDMTSSLVAEFNESKYSSTPVWPLWGNETWCMIGYHSVPVIVDAYFKGLLGPSAESAYQAIKRTAMNDRFGLDSYRKLGWVASRSGEQATSKTIEYSVDDWCIARMAEALGHREDAELFYRRSANYRNLFDQTTRLFRGRKADGRWRSPFDQLGLVGDEYTEADAWQYAFTVQHDVPGMISLYGGANRFIDRMDEMFANDAPIHTNIPDITGRIGQYAQGNEQCHHQAYLYVYAGAAYKTQAAIAKIRNFYTNKPDGQIGNNDCGQMSAWYVFSALGFYPVNPAAGIYIIGTPAYPSATVNLPNGKTFTVTAQNLTSENIYVQSASLNGKPIKRAWLTHKEVTDGGSLAFVMGPRPNIRWGTERPPATMPKGFKYQDLPQGADDKPVVLTLPIRIVCGSDDPAGNFIPDPNIVEGSTAHANVKVDTSVENAAPEEVYRSERYGQDFTYRFQVPAGKYTVRLHFAEVFDNAAGMRVEKIAINGTPVLAKFDIFTEAGGMNKALVRTFKDIAPDASGHINIRIQAEPDSPDQNAKISGIEILPG